MTRKYSINFNAEAFLRGSGTDFLPASADLGGDWVCERLGVPFDRYYMDYEFQTECLGEARSLVERELGLQLIGDMVYDHGVILNASLFGGRVRYHSNATPVLDPVISEPADVGPLARRIDALSDEALMHEGMLHPQYWKATEDRRNGQGKPPKAPASRGTKGVATVCGQLCTVTNFLTWILTDAEQMRELTALVGRTFLRYIRACRAFDADQGRNSLSFASDLSGLMSPRSYAEFCAPEEKLLYEAYAPTGTRYYHADSNMKNHVGTLADIGVTDVNIGPMVSVTDILDVSPTMIVHGQVPPTQVLWRGTPDLVVDAVRSDIDEIGSAGASLSQLRVCTAGSVNPGTPLENIRAMYWAAMTYGRFDGIVPGELGSIPVEFDRKTAVNQIS